MAAMHRIIENGLLLLPTIPTGSGPFPGRERQWLNDEGVSNDERWAAACLYLALMTETCLSLVGAKGPILVEGPFASNEAYLQALASLTLREVAALSGSTGTSQGAALLAGALLPPETPSTGYQCILPGLGAYRQEWWNRLVLFEC